MSAGLQPGDADATTAASAGAAGQVPRAPDPLTASLAEQLRLLWDVDLGDTPMAVRFEPAAPRD
jgi:hypothetical protein